MAPPRNGILAEDMHHADIDPFSDVAALEKGMRPVAWLCHRT
jgi:hypothetical protein